MANEQINVPSLVVILVLSGLIVRYLFFSSPTPPPQPRDSLSVLRSREAAVERIQQMFPQVDRRTILWDLHNNRGNVAATTERILAGQMQTPPITYQPPPPPGTPAAAGPSNRPAQAQTSKQVEKPAQPDLITRYNLKDKVAQAKAEDESGGSKKGWSANRDERQTLLQKRRDQMILEARRKMEAKMAQEKRATGEAGS